jgi:hypothetical protein
MPWFHWGRAAGPSRLPAFECGACRPGTPRAGWLLAAACLLPVVGITVGGFPDAARGELPSIRFDRLLPLGASAGTTVEVEVVGADIEQLQTLWFDHAGFSARPLEAKERFFEVTIAADVPPGTYDVRLVGRWGISNPRLFAVAHGLRDVAESEPNNELPQAQEIVINSAVAAVSDGNNEDLFRFLVKAGQRVVIDCQAGKLDSPMDATMKLSSADGRLLASSGDYNGRDPRIDFLVPADGAYIVHVHDLSYRGGFPYRLVLTDQGVIESVYPQVVQAGRESELTVIGRNLGAGAEPSSWTLDDLPLQERRLSLAAPAGVLQRSGFDFLEHPTDHSVLPTAATCTLTGFQMRLPDPASQGVRTIMVTPGPVTLENEPNDDMDQPQTLQLPAVVGARFNRPRDADWFAFDVAESGQYAFDVYCERIGGSADPYLVVMDDQGNRISELDDFGHRINAFDGHLRDPVGLVNLSEKRTYRVLVQDRYQRGGIRYQYVLSVHKPEPDFFAAVIHQQNPGPGGTTIWRGGAMYLDVVIHQRDGFNGEVTLTAERLPPGVHAAPTVINNNSRGVFVLWADDDAEEFTGPIGLLATGRQGDLTLQREVRAYTRVWPDAGMNSSRPTHELVVAVRDAAPYRLEWSQPQVEVEAGKTAALTLRLTRNDGNFQNDVTIQPLAFPGNFQMDNTKLSGAQREVTIEIRVQNGTRPGDYTLAVLGQAQVPFSKDPQATERPNTLVSLPSQPLTLSVKAVAKTDK